MLSIFFFFNDTATTEIYTLSLHDALPISNDEMLRATPELAHDHLVPYFRRRLKDVEFILLKLNQLLDRLQFQIPSEQLIRSEEHTSELQSRLHLVCRLLPQIKSRAESCRH